MKENWKNYYHKGLAAFFTVAMCILFYFVVFRFYEVKRYANMIMGILRPFAFGAVIAYLLCPVCNWFERQLAELSGLEKRPEKTAAQLRRMFAGVSILLSLSLFCLIIYALATMLISQVASSVQTLIEALPGYFQKAGIWLNRLAADNAIPMNFLETYWKEIMTEVQDFAKTHLLPNVSSIISGGSVGLRTMVLFLKDLIIGLIVAVYLMNSRKLFARQAEKVVRALFPPKEYEDPDREQTADWILRETHIINDYLGGFIKGKLLDSLIIGLICMFFTGIMKMPYAVLVSVVIGVTNIIPFFGPFIGAVPTAILILMVSPVKCVYFIIFILVLQQFDGNILGPKILGNSTGISGFWVMVAILVGGGLWGVLGMFLGVPIFACAYAGVRACAAYRLRKKGLPTDTASYLSHGPVRREEEPEENKAEQE